MTRLFFIYSTLAENILLLRRNFFYPLKSRLKPHKKAGEIYAPPALLCHRLLNLRLNYLAASSVFSSVALTASAVLAACTFTAVAGLLIGTPIEVSSAVLEVL